MAEEVMHQAHVYRCVGGEIHRRPMITEGLTPWQASWVVLNHGEEVPGEVLARLNTPTEKLRFD